MLKTLCRYTLSFSAATVVLAGCGTASTTPPVAAPAGMRAFEHMSRASGEVQYVSSDYGTTSLVEFDYPKSDSPIGQIPNVSGGLCTKGARTFWVTESDQVAEFIVGGAAPIRVLKASVGACAIDPTSGDLAATTSAGVIIFHKARGKGKVITGPALSRAYFDGYDNESNLFVDGFNGSGAFTLVEVKKGSSKFEAITTTNTIGFPGAVQSDGKYLTIGDQESSAINQYTVAGTVATLKGTVSLSGASDCAETWIARPYVYCADAGNNDVEVYQYPAGGSAIAILAGSLELPLSVVSLRVH